MSAAVATRLKSLPPEKVGPNVVFAVMPSKTNVGLIETIRASQGRLPWLGRHLERLKSSIAALGVPDPPDDLADLIRFAVGTGDRVVRVQVTDGHAEIMTRDVNAEQAIKLSERSIR